MNCDRRRHSDPNNDNSLIVWCATRLRDNGTCPAHYEHVDDLGPPSKGRKKGECRRCVAKAAQGEDYCVRCLDERDEGIPANEWLGFVDPDPRFRPKTKRKKKGGPADATIERERATDSSPPPPR